MEKTSNTVITLPHVLSPSLPALSPLEPKLVTLSTYKLRFCCDEQPFVDALGLLEQLAQRNPEHVYRFLGGLHTLSELLIFHLSQRERTGPERDEFRVTLRPSPPFHDFLLAAGAGHIE